MSAFIDAITARYAARESETDAFGRVIEVRRLRPGVALRIRVIVGSDVSSIETEALIASSVCSVTEPDGRRIEWDPPRNEVEVYGRIDFLEREGVGAAIRAYTKLSDVAAAPAADPAANLEPEPATDADA